MFRDYPDIAQYPELEALDHYNGGGKAEGRIWPWW